MVRWRGRVRRKLSEAIQSLAPVHRISPMAQIGADFVTPHDALGVAIIQHAQIGDRVTAFPHVIITRGDAGQVPYEESPFEAVVIEDDVILGARSTVVGGPGVTTVARGTLLGAGAVLLTSTEPGEVWVGVPARKVGMRQGWPEIRSTRSTRDR